MTAPLVVVEGGPAAVERAISDVRAAGWTTVAGWTGPVPRGTRCILVGEVTGQRDAEAALLAAFRGDGVLIIARSDRALIDRLIDDLRRLGPVDHRIGEPDAKPVIPAEARAVLGLLAEGHSLAEAAAILGLARRTADRRVAAARRALGVERTTEAVARARRLGWFGPVGSR